MWDSMMMSLYMPEIEEGFSDINYDSTGFI